MCFTGNFALSLMLEPAMRAPVLSQPSLPIGRRGGMHIAPDELAAVKARMEQEDLTVLAYRFAATPSAVPSASPPTSRRSATGSWVASYPIRRPIPRPR
jgi:hypothetical protein